MNERYQEAFSEVYEILNLMPMELYRKIPKKFVNLVKDERDKYYIPDIKEPIDQSLLKDETVIILGIIYRYFICSDEEKKILKQEEEKASKEKFDKDMDIKYYTHTITEILIILKSDKYKITKNRVEHYINNDRGEIEKKDIDILKQDFLDFTYYVVYAVNDWDNKYSKIDIDIPNWCIQIRTINNETSVYLGQEYSQNWKELYSHISILLNK